MGLSFLPLLLKEVAREISREGLIPPLKLAE
jgi:hypothetical protein